LGGRCGGFVIGLRAKALACYQTEAANKPARIRALKKSGEGGSAGTGHPEKSNNKKARGKAGGARRTLLERGVSAAPILGLYRMGRRTGIAFKRLKPLFHYSGIASKTGAPARPQFHGKPLLAALCETTADKGLEAGVSEKNRMLFYVPLPPLFRIRYPLPAYPAACGTCPLCALIPNGNVSLLFG
jgi:hypothetical protein